MQRRDHARDFVGGALHTLGQVAHFVGDYRETATHFPGAGGFDGGVEGKQVGLFGDAVDHPDHAVDSAGQACGAVVQLPGGACHGIDHALVSGLHGVEGAGHLADFILAGQRHPRRQVAGFFDVQHHILEGVELAEQEADQQLRGTEHGQHQHCHGDGVVGEAFTEHLAQARRVGEDCDLLAVAAADHLGADQRVFTEQRHGVEFSPAVGSAQGWQVLGDLAFGKCEPLLTSGQGSVGWPGA